MKSSLDKVVPWGRSYEEYISMFSLSDRDLQKRILGCGDGPAAFNTDLTGNGGTIVSVDPIYRFSQKEIRKRISETFDIIMANTRRNEDQFVWKHIRNVEELATVRMQAMERFLDDYPNADGRYVAGELPHLQFTDKEFDLALCSHLLFLYSERLSLEFHIQSITELCRIAHEVRFFPLVDLGSSRSCHLQSVLEHFNKAGYRICVEKVAYEFQENGNEMLRVASPSTGF